MAQTPPRGRSRRRLSLSVRLSLLVLFAALAPLAAVVYYNDHNANDALNTQARGALTTDAKAKVAQVDLYLNERIADGNALSQLITTPAYLACSDLPYFPATLAPAIAAAARCNDPVFNTTFDGNSNCRGLSVGVQRDPNYIRWALFDMHGHALLSAVGGTNPPNPANGCPATGVASPPREDLQALQRQTPVISGVYYDAKDNYAYVQVYVPCLVPTNPQQWAATGGASCLDFQNHPPSSSGSYITLGFMRATLKLNKIWDIVDTDQGANGPGSEAFITDGDGIRIASTVAYRLFTGVQPLSAQTQQLITSEQRFGQSTPPTVFNLPQISQSLQANHDQDTFTGILEPGSTAQYQFVRLNLTADQFASDGSSALNLLLKESGLHWSYFVLSPLSTVTAVAENQVRTSLLSAGIIAVLAVLIGLLVGRGTTGPVRSSARDLEGAAASLKALAARQQASAGEQHWVVDACKTGLEGVRYLSDAMNQAARRIIDVSNWFGEYWDRLTEDQARRTVQHLQELAHYVDEAARRQQDSSSRLDKAITVTMQVSDQLVAGANAATESAEQLEQVVNDLQHVVGGRRSSTPNESTPSARPDSYAQSRQDLPPAALPRQIMAPTAAPQPTYGSYSQGGYSQGGWPSSAEPGRSQAGWGEYSQYPQAPYGPYYGANGEYNGEYNGSYNGGAPGGGYDAGQGDNPWGNAGRMPPDGRSRGW